VTAYRDAFDQAMRSPQTFWRRAAEAITWSRPFERVLDDSRAPLYRWFPGGELNTCYNAIDLHVENGRASQAAVIYDSPVTATKRTLSYRELLRQVAQFAGALSALGVVKGDRVVIYMPMIPETLIAMYACARIGAIHSVVFGGFAANELAAGSGLDYYLTIAINVEQRIYFYLPPNIDQQLVTGNHGVVGWHRNTILRGNIFWWIKKQVAPKNWEINTC